MKILRIIAAAVLVVASGVGYTSISLQAQHSTTATQRTSQRVLSPTPGEFPIVALSVFNKEKGPQPGDLKGVEECGFNACIEETNLETHEKLLKYMEGTNLKLLAYNYVFSSDAKGNNWQQNMVNFVNKLKHHPNLGGWDFGDEPKWKDLNALKPRYELLRKTDPTHFISYNLVGQIAKDFTGPCKTLGVYLDSIQKKFEMDSWSSDFYPIRIVRGKLSVNYEQFYQNLEAFSKKSKETGIPMWTFCESLAYVADANTTFPIATLPYLSFEAFSALGYGSQGLAYYTYWQRKGIKVKMLSALVDMEGKKTKSWYAAQKVNLDIKALTPVLLGGEMIECRHTGKISFKGVKPSLGTFGPIESMTHGEKGVQVSHLRNGSKNYIMLVNHDVENKQKVNLTFKKTANMKQIKVDSGKLDKKSVKNNCSVTLTPGGYCIFEWN